MASSASTASASVMLTCLACGTSFRGSSGSCPTCRSELERTLAAIPSHPMFDTLRMEGETAVAAERRKPLPPAMPWAAATVGLIATLIAAFIAAWIQWDSGYWLILAFPAAIGFIGGAAMLVMTVRRQSIVYAYTPLIPVLIGLLGFASTFWMEYEFAVDSLEDAGYIDVREVVTFGTYLELKAAEPLNISRRSSSYEGEPGSPSAHYTLWTVEAIVAGIGGYLGWRKALTWLHEKSQA